MHIITKHKVFTPFSQKHMNTLFHAYAPLCNNMIKYYIFCRTNASVRTELWPTVSTKIGLLEIGFQFNHGLMRCVPRFPLTAFARTFLHISINNLQTGGKTIDSFISSLISKVQQWKHHVKNHLSNASDRFFRGLWLPRIIYSHFRIELWDGLLLGIK